MRVRVMRKAREPITMPAMTPGERPETWLLEEGGNDVGDEPSVIDVG